MKPLTHLLAATDLSATSLHAVDRGFLIAQETGARFTVVHALGLDALAPLHGLLGGAAPAFAQQITDAAAAALEEVIGDPARNRGVAATLKLESGLATTAIPACAEATQAELLVLGAHGKGFLQRMLLGSTASRLLRTSRCPVLVVKEPAHYAYRRMLVCVDFSPGCALALEAARAIAPRAHILLMHVVDVPFEGKLRFAGVSDEDIGRYRAQACTLAAGRLHDMAKAAGLAPSAYTVHMAAGDATAQVLVSEETYDCDLIVMGKHGTHVAEELLLGSVTKHVLAESRCDVLVVTDKRAPSL